jgi:hypothetical protein
MDGQEPTPPGTRRTTLVTNKQKEANKKSPLHASGLLGPVTLVEEHILK